MWEGDLIKGARNSSAVGTLVERTTRLVLLARLEGTDARSAREGFTEKLRHGPSMSDGPSGSRSRSAWPIRTAPGKRGTNENINGLLRCAIATDVWELHGRFQVPSATGE